MQSRGHAGADAQTHRVAHLYPAAAAVRVAVRGVASSQVAWPCVQIRPIAAGQG